MIGMCRLLAALHILFARGLRQVNEKATRKGGVRIENGCQHFVNGMFQNETDDKRC